MDKCLHVVSYVNNVAKILFKTSINFDFGQVIS